MTEKKSADIVVLDKDRPDTAYVVVELKKPKLKDGKNPLAPIANATGAPIGVWTNGAQISITIVKTPTILRTYRIFQRETEPQDILSERFTLRDLIVKDKIANERKSLKDIILEMEDEVLANAGVDVFEEVFKLIFTKLYDEYLSRRDKGVINYHVRGVTKTAVHDPAVEYSNAPTYLGGQDYGALREAVRGVSDEGFRIMAFRNTGQTDAELKEKIQDLFRSGQGAVEGVFPESSAFELSDSHLAVCVSSLQDVKAVQLQPVGGGRSLRVPGEQIRQGRNGAILYAAPRDRHVRANAQPQAGRVHD